MSDTLFDALAQADSELVALPWRQRLRIYLGGAATCDRWIERRAAEILAARADSCEAKKTEWITSDEETLNALRRSLLVMMSDWSESTWAAGWMSGTERMLHGQAGIWEILGRAVGWPTGYEHDPDFRWVTWDEAGKLFNEERKTNE